MPTSGLPVAWTSDSKAVVFESFRDDRWQILRQGLEEDAPTPIATEARETMKDVRVSPDGKWVLYTTLEGPGSGLGLPGSTSMTRYIKRVATAGGSPEVVGDGASRLHWTALRPRSFEFVRNREADTGFQASCVC